MIGSVVCCLRILGNDFPQPSLRLTGRPLGDGGGGGTGGKGQGGSRRFSSFLRCSRRLTVSQPPWQSDGYPCFIDWGKLGLREVKQLPKATQLISGKAGIRTQFSLAFILVR